MADLEESDDEPNNFMVTLYGLKTCDSCRKARRTLEAQGVTARFVDLRTDFTEHGLDDALLDRFINDAGWECLLNKKSTTWRSLDDTDRQTLDAAKARRLMQAHPTLIKRPLLDTGERLIVGFDAEAYARLTALDEPR